MQLLQLVQLLLGHTIMYTTKMIQKHRSWTPDGPTWGSKTATASFACMCDEHVCMSTPHHDSEHIDQISQLSLDQLIPLNICAHLPYPACLNFLKYSHTEQARTMHACINSPCIYHTPFIAIHAKQTLTSVHTYSLHTQPTLIQQPLHHHWLWQSSVATTSDELSSGCLSIIHKSFTYPASMHDWKQGSTTIKTLVQCHLNASYQYVLTATLFQVALQPTAGAAWSPVIRSSRCHWLAVCMY
jgi:hypothetical protein